MAALRMWQTTFLSTSPVCRQSVDFVTSFETILVTLATCIPSLTETFGKQTKAAAQIAGGNYFGCVRLCLSFLPSLV